MKLSIDALKKINNKKTRALLALALDKSEQTIIRYITKNNDELTKALAISIIKQETGLSEDEILVGEAVTV